MANEILKELLERESAHCHYTERDLKWKDYMWEYRDTVSMKICTDLFDTFLKFYQHDSEIVVLMCKLLYNEYEKRSYYHLGYHRERSWEEYCRTFKFYSSEYNDYFADLILEQFEYFLKKYLNKTVFIELDWNFLKTGKYEMNIRHPAMVKVALFGKDIHFNYHLPLNQ